LVTRQSVLALVLAFTVIYIDFWGLGYFRSDLLCFTEFYHFALQSTIDLACSILSICESFISLSDRFTLLE